MKINPKRSFIYVDDASLATFKICMKGKLGEIMGIFQPMLLKL